jgi:hypothetical protein
LLHNGARRRPSTWLNLVEIVGMNHEILLNDRSDSR